MATSRKKLSVGVEVSVVSRSKRRCALCFGLFRDVEVKRGQIAHVDRDRTNDAEDNLAFLCLPHHDEYDTTPSQSKRFTPDELRQYRDELYAFMADQPPLSWPDVETPPRSKRKHRELSVELYDRRLRLYHTAKDLIGRVVALAALDMDSVKKFGADTEEGAFLFDQGVSEFLAELYKHGVWLATLTEVLKGEPLGERRVQHVEKQMELVLWFNDQFGKLRSQMAPFLTFG
jgi:hypothetical protein